MNNNAVRHAIEHGNLVIAMNSVGDTADFSCLMSDKIIDLHTVGSSQCFPLYWYEEIQAPLDLSHYTDCDQKTTNMDAWEAHLPTKSFKRHDAITDFILGEARNIYGAAVSKLDMFFYVYGFLHSPQYRIKFADDLKKSLPRIPLVERTDDFWAFSKAGSELADLHICYEDAEWHPDVVVRGLEAFDFKVVKMKFGKTGKDADTSKIIYNDSITIENIPSLAYEYVVNGRSAIHWVMERYQIKTDKPSGITNDPNLWAQEHGKPRYILDLLLSVINVSVRTVEIVRNLPYSIQSGGLKAATCNSFRSYV